MNICQTLSRQFVDVQIKWDFLVATLIGKGTTAGLPTCPNEPTAMPGDWESFRVHACLIDIESQRLLKVVTGASGNLGAGFIQL